MRAVSGKHYFSKTLFSFTKQNAVNIFTSTQSSRLKQAGETGSTLLVVFGVAFVILVLFLVGW